YRRSSRQQQLFSASPPPFPRRRTSTLTGRVAPFPKGWPVTGIVPPAFPDRQFYVPPFSLRRKGSGLPRRWDRIQPLRPAILPTSVRPTTASSTRDRSPGNCIAPRSSPAVRAALE